MQRDRVQVLVGDNDFQWEIRFSREVHRETGVNVFVVPSITVQIDPRSGDLSLWNGTMPGSIEEHAETTLFESCRAEIEEALLQRGAHLTPAADVVATPAFA